MGDPNGRALSCTELDAPAWWIDPGWWKHLQSCLWESPYKRPLAAYPKEQPMCRQQVSSKEMYHDDHKLDVQ